MCRSTRQSQKGSVCIYQSPKDVYEETPDFNDNYEYLTELQNEFSNHIRTKWPWLYESKHKYELEDVEVPIEADVDDVFKAMIVPFTTDINLIVTNIEINPLETETDLVYYMFMKAWGSFFKDISENIT